MPSLRGHREHNRNNEERRRHYGKRRQRPPSRVMCRVRRKLWDGRLVHTRVSRRNSMLDRKCGRVLTRVRPRLCACADSTAPRGRCASARTIVGASTRRTSASSPLTLPRSNGVPRVHGIPHKDCHSRPRTHGPVPIVPNYSSPTPLRVTNSSYLTWAAWFSPHAAMRQREFPFVSPLSHA